MGFVRGPFEKFLDSPYYSESELCGGAMTGLLFEVSPLASDALLTTLHPLFENVLQIVCRKPQEDSGTGGFESTNFSNGPRSCSAILKRVILKRP
jgi:hypothetical protein